MSRLHVSQKERTCFICHAPIKIGQPYKGTGERSKHPGCIGARFRTGMTRPDQEKQKALDFWEREYQRCGRRN
jgi:hypothetical protein